jgi:hypothetical protein
MPRRSREGNAENDGIFIGSGDATSVQAQNGRANSSILSRDGVGMQKASMVLTRRRD